MVAQPDKPAGRGMKLQAPAVAVRARELGLPLLQPPKIRTPEFLDTIAQLAPDLGIVVALVAFAVAGVFTAPANAAMLLLRDQESPAAVRSQVFTIGAGLRAAAAAVGAALAGAASGLDAGWLILGIAAVWIASGLLLTLFPRPVDTR